MKDKIYSNIDGNLFENIVVCGVNNLKANIKIVNDLNVFPIPDGDTGDNMYMTISGGIKGLRSVEENSISLKAKALADGMLLNARGNSGVILSQLFFGLSNGLAGKEEVNIEEFVYALDQGVKQAYASVVKPVEGTMLTVARESCEKILERRKFNYSLEEFFQVFIKEMHASLDRTPELLDALKEAGVIDSGGAGLLYITEGMEKGALGQTIDEVAVTESTNTVDFSKFNENSEMVFGYCTECLLQLQTKKVDVNSFDVQVIIDFLQGIGDSIVAFKTGTIIKLHVHTMTPAKVIEFCQQFGEFLTIKIENMTLQHNETESQNKNTHSFENLKPNKKRKHKKYSVVTVGTGKGLIDTFSELGADVVIDGGQGNNPSIERFIEAFDEADADVIYVLPNNSNIIMAAKQAAGMYEKSKIMVLETKNFGQAYSVLSMLDFSADNAEEIFEQMKEAMVGVVTGMITSSIRTANIDGVAIEKDDYIGFTDKTMLVAEKDKVQTFKSLSKTLCVDDKFILIAVYGKDVTEEEKNSVREFVGADLSSMEFYEIDGGQDVYDFILIIE